jgi:hypothetical protein
MTKVIAFSTLGLKLLKITGLIFLLKRKRILMKKHEEKQNPTCPNISFLSIAIFSEKLWSQEPQASNFLK